MANVDEKVMAMVERELEKNPDLGSSDLFEKVKGKHPSVAELSIRQFHARYPLQVKRRKSASSGPKTAAKKKPAAKKSKSKKSGGRAAAAKKTSAPRARRSPTTQAAPRGTREAVRGVLMRFATELASAEAKADVVKVLAGADRYVDEVIDATAS